MRLLALTSSINTLKEKAEALVSATREIVGQVAQSV